MKINLMTLIAAFVVLASAVGSATAGGRPLTAILTGAAEVPGPGDEDGSGVMELTLNPGQKEICWELTVEKIDPPTRAHIHQGEAGTNGGVVVFFFDTVIPTPIPVPSPLSGCVDVDRSLIRDIIKRPSGYYINVHNEAFPPGAIRGQLMK